MTLLSWSEDKHESQTCVLLSKLGLETICLQLYLSFIHAGPVLFLTFIYMYSASRDLMKTFKIHIFLDTVSNVFQNLDVYKIAWGLQIDIRSNHSSLKSQRLLWQELLCYACWYSALFFQFQLPWHILKVLQELDGETAVFCHLDWSWLIFALSSDAAVSAYSCSMLSLYLFCSGTFILFVITSVYFFQGRRHAY